MIGNHFLDIMIHQRFTGHQSYVLLCPETTLSNPKSSCDVHLLRSLWPRALKTLHFYFCTLKKWNNFCKEFCKKLSKGCNAFDQTSKKHYFNSKDWTFKNRITFGYCLSCAIYRRKKLYCIIKTFDKNTNNGIFNEKCALLSRCSFNRAFTFLKASLAHI